MKKLLFVFGVLVLMTACTCKTQPVSNTISADSLAIDSALIDTVNID